jgi:hypothetical protein
MPPAPKGRAKPTPKPKPKPAQAPHAGGAPYAWCTGEAPCQALFEETLAEVHGIMDGWRERLEQHAEIAMSIDWNWANVEATAISLAVVKARYAYHKMPAAVKRAREGDMRRLFAANVAAAVMQRVWGAAGAATLDAPSEAYQRRWVGMLGDAAGAWLNNLSGNAAYAGEAQAGGRRRRASSSSGKKQR